MTFCFVPSLHHTASLGCWGWRNHRQSRSGAGGTEPQNSPGLLGVGCGGIDTGDEWLAGPDGQMTACMYVAVGREHFAFISSNFNTTLRRRERNKFYFPWSEIKCLVSQARHPKPRCMELAVFLKEPHGYGCDEAAPVHFS